MPPSARTAICLAYLVRRLLENGANSSFVNQIVNEEVAPERVAACPITAMEGMAAVASPAILTGPQLFAGRVNSRGWDLTDAGDLAGIEAARAPYHQQSFEAAPMLAGRMAGGLRSDVLNPATGARLGHVLAAAPADVDTALRLAEPWEAEPAIRAEVLRRAADLYEAEFGPIFALLAREAGKSLADAVAELREAVDFLRYYANGAEALRHPARGIFACISPWNFPLAIFSGQIGAALAAGNAVLAKPAQQTPLIAALAVRLLHQAGVPATALQLLPGDGTVGAALTSDARVKGVAFTGSTETALKIRANMAEHLAPTAPLIAETGGLNAMLVDSTALPEQAVRDILASSFQSAGQRCSALRCLYVQEDVAPTVQDMLFGAMDELALGDPWDLATDVGPVIDAEAQAGIRDYIEAARAEGRVLQRARRTATGPFHRPHRDARRLASPICRARSSARCCISPPSRRARSTRSWHAVNATGYGLTFGLHTRIDDRVQAVIEALHVGNLYVNRNQIGAVVGSQPFGGEGLSGTGPKAGGPEYLHRFTAQRPRDPRSGHPDRRDRHRSRCWRSAARCRCARPRAARADRRIQPPDLRAARAAAVPWPGAASRAGPGRGDPRPWWPGGRGRGPRAAALTRLQGFSGALWWGDADARPRPRARPCRAQRPDPAADRRDARRRPCSCWNVTSASTPPPRAATRNCWPKSRLTCLRSSSLRKYPRGERQAARGAEGPRIPLDAARQIGNPKPMFPIRDHNPSGRVPYVTYAPDRGEYRGVSGLLASSARRLRAGGVLLHLGAGACAGDARAGLRYPDHAICSCTAAGCTWPVTCCFCGYLATIWKMRWAMSRYLLFYLACGLAAAALADRGRSLVRRRR